MEFLKAINIKNRMCKYFNDCIVCPLSIINNKINETCLMFVTHHPEEAEEILIKWGERTSEKTMFQDFLEKYPNAPLNENGIPMTCPYKLGYDAVCTDCKFDCKKCWNRPLED